MCKKRFSFAGAGRSYRACIAGTQGRGARSAGQRDAQSGGRVIAARADASVSDARKVCLPACGRGLDALEPTEKCSHRDGAGTGQVLQQRIEGVRATCFLSAVQLCMAVLPVQLCKALAQRVEQHQAAAVGIAMQLEHCRKRLRRLPLPFTLCLCLGLCLGLNLQRDAPAPRIFLRPGAGCRRGATHEPQQQGQDNNGTAHQCDGATHQGATPRRCSGSFRVSLSGLLRCPSFQTLDAASLSPRLHSTSPRWAAISTSGRVLLAASRYRLAWVLCPRRNPTHPRLSMMKGSPAASSSAFKINCLASTSRVPRSATRKTKAVLAKFFFFFFPI